MEGDLILGNPAVPQVEIDMLADTTAPNAKSKAATFTNAQKRQENKNKSSDLKKINGSHLQNLQ